MQKKHQGKAKNDKIINFESNCKAIMRKDVR